MKAYPIWTEVTACNYKSSKSYGSKDTSQQIIYVGTSKNNSHELAEIITTRRQIDDKIHFKLSVDDVIMKETVMCAKTKEIINEFNYIK